LNHHRPKMNGKAKEGIAFGEAILMLSPPNRSQIEVNLESGFGGWVDEKIKTAREAAPHLGWKKSHPQHLTVARMCPVMTQSFFANAIAQAKMLCAIRVNLTRFLLIDCQFLELQLKKFALVTGGIHST